MRLVSLKFELTNQDSAGEKSHTVQTSMYVNKKGRLQATILVGNGVRDSVEYLRKNSKDRIRLFEVKNIKRFVASTF